MNSWKEMLYVFVGWLPFTVGGSVLLLGSISALWFLGVQRSDLIMVVLGATGIALSLLGVIVTWLAGFTTYRRLQQIPFDTVQMLSHQPANISFEIPLPWWIPLVQAESFWKNDSFVLMENQQSPLSQERIFPKRRGQWSTIVREIRVGDAFGICKVRFDVAQNLHLQVLPSNLQLENPMLIQGLQGGAEIPHPLGRPEGDRIDMRNYAVGDPIRYILWKVYARSNELMIRTPERAYEPVKKMLGYLIVDKQDRISAATATSILQSGALGEDWIFGVDGNLGLFSEKNAAIEAIIGSGLSLLSKNPKDQQGGGLGQFIAQAQQQGGNHTLILFAPPKIGPWIEHVCSIQKQIPIQVIVGVEQIAIDRKWDSLKNAIFLPKEHDYSEVSTWEDLQKIQEALQSFNIPILLSGAEQSSLQLLSKVLAQQGLEGKK